MHFARGNQLGLASDWLSVLEAWSTQEAATPTLMVMLPRGLACIPLIATTRPDRVHPGGGPCQAKSLTQRVSAVEGVGDP